MLRSLRNIARLLGIVRTLARHDALFLLENLGVAELAVFCAKLISRRRQEGRPGQRLALAMSESGPGFIKLGQALSTRSDILGEEMAGDLSGLQDRLLPFSGTEARAAIEAEFGTDLENLFSEFNDQAIAAASIAQVHFAVTTDGREVAVKVLRPGIEDAFSRDIEMFSWIAERVEAARPEWRRLKPIDMVKTLAESVTIEMDLRFEASAAQELAENFADDETFHVPRVDWTRTGRRVLTTERVSGVRLDDRDAIVAAGHDPQQVLAKSSGAFFKQVFRDGFFHADLHAGNLFVRDDGNIAVVDFGIMGRIGKRDRFALAEMLLAFLSRDYRRAAQIHFDVGWVPAHRSVDQFTQACRSIAEPIMDKPQNEISFARLLGQLFQVAKTFDMEAQPQLLLLQKTMLVGEGTGRQLAPEANMWMLARPLVDDWVTANLGPDRQIREAAKEFSTTIGRLPKMLGDLETGAAMIANGEIKLHPDTIHALRGESGYGSVIPWLIAGIATGLLVAWII